MPFLVISCAQVDVPSVLARAPQRGGRNASMDMFNAYDTREHNLNGCTIL